MPDINRLERLQAQLREFAEQRDWDQFHTPKNLAMALAAEAGELVEPFQWLTPEQSVLLPDRTRAEVGLSTLRKAARLGESQQHDDHVRAPS